MKKTTRKIVIVITGILLVAVISLAINYYPMLQMQPLETGQIEATGVTAVKNNRNDLYLLKAEDGWLVVDAGTKLDGVEESLKQLGIEPDEVAYLLLTHTDSDHVGAAELFKNARIYISEDEAVMLSGEQKRNFFGYNQLSENVDTEKIVYLTESEINLGGFDIKCIKTPGHTPGSMSYLIDNKYLFSGDAFMVSGSAMKVHPYTMDAVQAEASIERLKAEKAAAELVFTAHYGYYKAADIE